MDEMDAQPVDVGGELVEGVEVSFLFTPVVLGEPVLHQLAQIAELGAVVPVGAVELIGETGIDESLAEIVENRLIDGDLERPDRAGTLLIDVRNGGCRWVAVGLRADQARGQTKRVHQAQAAR